MFKFAKKILTALTFLVGVFFVYHLALAATADLGINAVGQGLLLSATDPRIIASRIIQIFLGLLGMIAIGLIIYGGFLWMTAAGNEEKIDQAKRTLVSAVIGLIIILSAFGIATFILNQLLAATGGGGGGGGNGPGGNSIGGAGAIGECSVQSVYPTPNQTEVPRNTGIFVTFKEAIDPSTICATVDGSGNCAPQSLLKISNVKIYKTSDGDNASTNVSAQVTETADHKTFVFKPVSFLGSATENIWYTVNLTGDVQLEADHSSAFSGSGCSGSLTWQFQTSNKIDLTPPQVVASGVYPPPDNGRDNSNNVLPKQSVGSISVFGVPREFVAAQATVIPTITGTPAADITVDPNADTSATLYVFVAQGVNGMVATLTDKNNSKLGSANFIGNTVSFSGAYPFSLTAKGSDITSANSGNEWTVTITAATSADSLTVGSMIYTFVINSAGDNQITAGHTIKDSVRNIVNALNKQTEVTAATTTPTQISVTAAAAGKAGDSITLVFNSSFKPAVLNTVAMSGGDDGSSGANYKVNTAGNQPDQPMNTVIQINFSEPVLPTTVVGNSSVVQAIKVVNADGGGGNGAACTDDSKCLSYKCSAAKKCEGDVVAGKFAIANLYRTVEFTSDDQCGVNGCGEPIYCLPANSHLVVKIKAASLNPCNANAECASYNIDGKAYDQCLNNVCSDNLGGNYAATNPELRRYPFANIQASAQGPDGVTDAAFNSLDGDRNTFADGSGGSYSDNPTIYSNNQLCQDNFSEIINAVIATRLKQNKTLGEITAADTGAVYKYYTTGACAALGAAGCENLMNKEMKDIGLSGALKDGSGNIFMLDENEDEPSWGACLKDYVVTNAGSCSLAPIPTFYCTKGDDFSWSFFVSKEMDVSAPIVLATSPDNAQTSLLDQDIKIDFSKLMMASTLITGSTVIVNPLDGGQTKVTHKNINLWSKAGNPVGYWVETENILQNGVLNSTNAVIKHGNFGESASYRAQAGSAVRDIHQNCFKPSADQGACGVSESSPSCCSGTAVKDLGPDGNCP